MIGAFPAPILAFLPGGGEWVIVIVLVILFFGAAKIPELARGLGRAKGEFEKGSRESAKELQKERTLERDEEERVLKAARELGVPTEGRSLADIKADLRAKMA